MKGWLDKYNDGGPVQPNYNDYSVSAGPGFEGDGYSNVGRNYSPAWGGQFADGGELQPIYVTDKKDPRLKAYKDSLDSWKSGVSYNKLLKTYSGTIPNSYDLITDPKKISKIKTDSKVKPTSGLFFNRDKYIKSFIASDGRDAPHLNPDPEKAKRLGATKYGDGNYYNKDHAMLVADMYSFKKPTQPVIYQKPEPTPQSTIDWMEGNYAQEPITETPQQSTPSWGEVVDPRTGYTHMTRQGVPMYPLVGQKIPEMAMGGSLPGSVGFMYARTQDPAPSKGKYAKKTMASAQNGTEMEFYQNGLDFKPKSISKNGKKIIKDDMGQWAYPGEITEIGSNQITMKDVPYPVMGISDTGDIQMMYPDEDYVYDGESVTEIPIMAQGGQLTKLDQLTNFTNYNTKQPGGWLNKYQ